MSKRRNQFTGRRAILGLMAAAIADSISGCAWARTEPLPVCPENPEVSFPNGPLTIDAHCHVFNGSDLQIRDFLGKAAYNQGGALGIGAYILGSILQSVAWSDAPDGASEITELQSIFATNPCITSESSSRVATLRRKGYSNGRQQLKAALRKSTEFKPLFEKLNSKQLPLDMEEKSKAMLDAIQIIESLPESMETYRASKRSALVVTHSESGYSIKGMIDFILQNFQYRYVSVCDYLNTFNEPGVRTVDLMLPSMVDYDWWLSDGKGTPTTLRQQVLTMEQISIVTGGRVHGFVPFCPLRQVAYDLSHAPEDSMTLVIEAITKHGFIGVKLYPPMGFAPLGNEGVQKLNGAHFWARDWLPTWTDRPDLGTLLDGAMRRLFKWCQDNDVPVMAHTSQSNGVVKDFEALTAPQYWRNAVTEFPKLRINFGHFGDSLILDDNSSNATAMTQLMNSGPNQIGQNAYADAAYFVEILKEEPKLQTAIDYLFDSTATKGDAALVNRFLYGTDWEMTLVESHISTYLSQFVELCNAIEALPAIQAHGHTGLSAKFFGLNAVNFIGLKKGGLARARLDSFYAANKVPQPDWMVKVDK